MTLDPSKLLLLLALREHGSITRVAEHCGRTPPAVSQQLARLEREVGVRLVDRHPHGIHLTPLGLQLAERAQLVDQALRSAAEDAAQFLDQHRNRLRLGAFPTAGRALLPEVLAALRHRHPEAELSVVDLGPHEGVNRVADHELDLALVSEYGERIDVPPGVELLHLLDDPLTAVVPTGHRFEMRTGSDLRLCDFARDAWVAAPTTLPNRRQLDQAARTQGFTPVVPFEFESYAVAEALVSAGVAVSFIPRLALSNVPGTVRLELDEPTLTRRIFTVVPTHSQHAPLAAVCLRLLRDLR